MKASLREAIERARLSMGKVDSAEPEVDKTKLYESAGIPKRFWDSPEQPKFFEAVDDGRNIFIFGGIGTGKTQLACGIAKSYIEKSPFGATYVSSVRLLAEIRATYDTAQSELQVIGKYGKARLLILDDLGKEVPTEWALERLFGLVDERYAAKRPTIVTSNFAPSDLIARLGSRGEAETAAAIVSRLIEGALKLRLNGDDRRLR